MKNPNEKKPLIARILINYRFPLSLFVVLVLTASVWAVLKVSIEVMPKENTPPFLYVHVNANQNMSPEKQELGLTLPLEGAMRTVPNVLTLNTSTNSSGVSLSINFKPRTELDLAEINVQEALQDLDSQGIVNLKNVVISRANPEASPLIRMALNLNTNSSNELIKMKEELQIALEMVSEVSKVEIIGIEPLEVHYPILLHRAEEFGIAGKNLGMLFEAQSVRESLGVLVTSPGLPSTSVSARLINNDLKKIERQSLIPRSSISLNQFSESFIVDKGQVDISHKDGKKTIFLEIYNKEGVNLFELKEHIEDALNHIQKNPEFKNLSFVKIYDKTDDLQSAIREVFKSLIEALLITFIIVFLFLRQMPQTILISIAIPTALLFTVSFLYFRGFSLNMLTLSGLILGVGMVVDSAVLVVNRITERLALGEKPIIASAQGAQLSLQPLLMSTLTNSAIFLPVAFLDGGDSLTDILRGFQVPLLATLGSSLFVSLFFIPLIAIFFDLKVANHSKKLEEKSRRFFRRSQKYAGKIIFCTFIIVYGASQYAKDIQQTDLESPPDAYSTVNIRFAPEISTEQRRESFLKFEKKLLEQKESIHYQFMVSEYNPNLLSGSLVLYPVKNGNLDESLRIQNEKIKNFLDSLKSAEPGVSISLGWNFEGRNYSNFQARDTLRLAGPKMVKLMNIGQDLKSRIEQIQGVDFVKLENEMEGEKAYFFLPNEGMLLQYGLNLQSLSGFVMSQMSSLSMGPLNYDGKLVGAKIYLIPEEKRWSLSLIKNLQIPVGGGKSVLFGQLGNFAPEILSRSIPRKEFNSKYSLTVFYSNSANLAKTRGIVQNVFSSFSYPEGYGPPPPEDQSRILEMQKKSTFILVLSGLLIYLLLGAMFESVFTPLAIIFTVPLALVFGVAGLKFLGFDLDVMARLSLIILVGIGVNSAIILIDLISELRSSGVRRIDAVVVGCSRRLKAVFMTAGIQVLSVLPVALGKSKLMGIPYSSLGVCIISGMLFSTIITLVILPIIYQHFDETEIVLSEKFGFSTVSTKNQHQVG